MSSRSQHCHPKEQDETLLHEADSEGETPIHICAHEGQLGLAQTLGAFGCTVDLANDEVMQPLHLAAKYSNAGDIIDAKNREGVTPEVCAQVQGHVALGDLLNNHPANNKDQDKVLRQLLYRQDNPN